LQSIRIGIDLVIHVDIKEHPSDNSEKSPYYLS
jgi:hypothetical protein